jgi:uncharacterized membrane protein YbhN (UPF0104 family)
LTGSSQGRDRWRRGISFLLRFGLATAIVAWLIYTAGWREILSIVAGANPWLILGAVGALALEVLARVWNWARLLDSLGCITKGRRARLLRAFLVGALLGNVLPSTLGTDALRGIFAQREFGGRPSLHAAAIVIQNMLVFIAASSVGIACLGALYATGQAPVYAPQAAVLFAGVIAAGVGLHVALKHYRSAWVQFLRRALRRRWYPVRRAARRFADSLLVFERAHVRFAPRAIVAVLCFVATASVHALVAMAVGIDVSPVVWGAVLPLLSLSAYLPISISGLGGAQAVYVLLLAPFGVGVAQAFTASALYAMLYVAFTALLGSLAWLLAPDGVKSAPSA